ncbi:hypothetical protein [Duganella sp. P38]|uniref:hypothetical protein n=1 Tax=Duganella sp. P38 TaxID=3423949 RepID=UPI003D7BA76D
MFDNSFGYKGHRVDIEATEISVERWQWSFHIDGVNQTEMHVRPFKTKELALLDAAEKAKQRIDEGH